MDYSQFLNMPEELSLMAVILLLFVADLFICKDKTPTEEGILHGNKIGNIAIVLMIFQVASNFLPTCLGCSPANEAFGGMYVHTPMMTIMKSILSIGTLITFLMANGYMRQTANIVKQGEFYIVTLFTLLGMYFMISAGHFIMFFIGLEMASVPMAALIAYDKYRYESAEAGAKFILLALFSSALLLYGVSFIYGATGSLYFSEIHDRFAADHTLLSTIGLLLFLSGMGFKISLVPFHLWAADTYQGAPTVVTGYLSVISKGSAAFVLFTVLIKAFAGEGFSEEWNTALFWIIIASITIANLFAIQQQNLQRYFASRLSRIGRNGWNGRRNDLFGLLSPCLYGGQLRRIYRYQRD